MHREFYLPWGEVLSQEEFYLLWGGVLISVIISLLALDFLLRVSVPSTARPLVA